MKAVSVHMDFFKQIRKHSAEEIGNFFLALAADIDGDERPELPLTLEMIKEMVDDQNTRFSNQQREKRQKKPSEPKQPNKPNGTKKTNATSDTVTDTEAISDTKTDSQGQEKKEPPCIPPENKPADENAACAAAWVEWMSDRGKAEKPPPALPNDFGEPVRRALCDWLRYKKERREKYVPTGLARHFSIVRNQVNKHGEKAVADLMGYCMGRGWQGVIWDMINTPEVAAASAEEEVRVNGADKEMLPDVPVDVGKMTEDEKWESLNRPPGAARTPTH